MSKFYRTLIIGTVVVLITIAILYTLTITWNSIIYIFTGPIVEKYITYNTTSIKKIIIDLNNVNIKVSRGKPKIHIYVRKYCNVNIMEIGNMLIISNNIRRNPFLPLICQNSKIELWIPINLEELKVRVSSSSIVIDNINVSKASIIINSGSAKISMSISKILNILNNMGSIFMNIKPNSRAMINIHNNMGSMYIELETDGVTMNIVENNMGSIKNLCKIGTAVTLSIVNNMGSILIRCIGKT